MKIDKVDNYFIVLQDTLIKYGISKQFANEIIKSISTRIYSIIFHWKDDVFRRTALFIGLDEASFYEPLSANLDLKSFVVIAIRNSLIETPQSEDYAVAGLKKQLSNEFVKRITREAICYFADFDFEKESLNCNNIVEDYYGNIVCKYPLAWSILNILSDKKQNRIEFEAIKSIKPNSLLQDLKLHNAQVKHAKNLNQIVENGMDPRINDDLKNMLIMLESNQADCFYVDSFKGATRNFEKLMYILELVLSLNKVFCTNNYYISNGYIEKRNPIIRPAHNFEDFKRNILNLDGTQEKHKEYLLSYGDSF